MTIRIKKDKIEFVDDASGNTFTLKETGTGFTFDGTIASWEVRPNTYTGTASGYHAGGFTIPGTAITTIDKMSLVSDGNSSATGNLTQARGSQQGMSSLTHGYSAGGYWGPVGTVATFEKYPFASNSNSTSIPSLPVARRFEANSGVVYTGGQVGWICGGNPGYTTMTKISFNQDGSNSNSGGYLADGGRNSYTAISSTTHGFFATGSTQQPAPGYSTDKILRFPFAAGGSNPIAGINSQLAAIQVSPTSVTPIARLYSHGHQSSTSGYIYGGQSPAGPGTDQYVMRFPFAADNIVTNIGGLGPSSVAVGYNGGAAVSSPQFGFIVGGTNGGYMPGVRILKYPFASELNVTSVGSLTTSHGQGSPGQV